MEVEHVMFEHIAEEFARNHEYVAPGKMMSSPALTYKKKVFAFYYQRQMVFRLGRDFDPVTGNVHSYRLLSPFKNKPPMRDWFEIPFSKKDKWEKLAHQALDLMIRKVDGSPVAKTVHKKG